MGPSAPLPTEECWLWPVTPARRVVAPCAAAPPTIPLTADRDGAPRPAGALPRPAAPPRTPVALSRPTVPPRPPVEPRAPAALSAPVVPPRRPVPPRTPVRPPRPGAPREPVRPPRPGAPRGPVRAPRSGRPPRSDAPPAPRPASRPVGSAAEPPGAGTAAGTVTGPYLATEADATPATSTLLMTMLPARAVAEAMAIRLLFTTRSIPDSDGTRTAYAAD